jgi:CubicO group peptidase (beta-lactamase class C family)
VHSRFEEHPEQLITLRHLLSHKAGFTHEAPVGNNFADSPSFEAHIASISDTWLRYPVGQRYSYSNLGIDLAAHILQVVSRKPFSQVMKETLFDPLGMTNSSTSIAVIRENQNRAIGHSDGVRVPRLDIPMLGAGGVYASAADMARFVRFFLNDGWVGEQQFLEQTLVEEMFTVPFAVPGQTEGYALGIS